MATAQITSCYNYIIVYIDNKCKAFPHADSFLQKMLVFYRENALQNLLCSASEAL